MYMPLNSNASTRFKFDANSLQGRIVCRLVYCSHV